MLKPAQLITKRVFVIAIMLTAVILFAPGSVKAEPKAGSGLSVNPATPSSQVANVSCTPLIKSNSSFLSFPTWYQYITAGKTDANGNCTVPDIQLDKATTPTACTAIDTPSSTCTPTCTSTVTAMCGTTTPPSNNGFSGTGILLVLLAIIDILLRLSGLVALGFIVYGGIRFVTSQGSSDGTKQARETVLNGIIGMVIATVAIAVVTFLGDRLG